MSTISPNSVAETAPTAVVEAPPSTAAAGSARLVVLYSTPADTAAFDEYYFSKHVPLAKELPGLRSYTVSHGGVITPGAAEPPYHLFAELQFDSVEALNAAMASPQGAAAVADLANFASAGTTITIMETKAL